MHSLKLASTLQKRNKEKGRVRHMLNQKQAKLMMKWFPRTEEMKWKMFAATDPRLHTVLKENALVNTVPSHLQPNVTRSCVWPQCAHFTY